MTSAVNNEFPGVSTLISGNTAANSLFQSQHRENPALVCCPVIQRWHWVPRAPTCKAEFHICSWNSRLFPCAGNTRCSAVTCPSYPGAASGKHTKKKCTKVCNKEIRESNKRGKKQTNKTPNLRSCPQKEVRKKGKIKIHTCSLCLLPLRLRDNFCCPHTLIYNPVSCKTYTLKSLLNEILVRSRDSTSSWKHVGYYSSTFSFHHQWLSDDNSSGCTRSAHAAQRPLQCQAIHGRHTSPQAKR